MYFKSIICLISCFVMLINIGFASEEDGHQKVVNLTPEQSKLALIKSEPVKQGYLDISLSVVGEISCNKNKLYHVSSQIKGIVGEIWANLGDSIGANTKLATIISRELANIKANYLASIASLNLAKNNLTREHKLLKQNISPKKDYFLAENDFQKAQINFDMQKNKLIALGLTDEELTLIKKQKLNQYKLKSHEQGIVIEKHAAKGEFVDVDSKLFTIADLDKIWVIADVYEKDIAKIKLGQQATIKTKAYKQKKFEGKIGWISDIMDDKLRTLKIRIEVDNKDYLLKPGMLVNINLNIASKQKKSLLVAREALIRKGSDNYLFLDQGSNKYLLQEIEIADVSSKYMEVVSGVEPNDNVVVKGAFILNSEMEKSNIGDGH